MATTIIVSDKYVGPERRRPGRPAAGTFDELIARLRIDDGPAFRVGDIATLTGYSRWKILGDIDRGLLKAHRIPCGSRFEYVVSHAQVRRYAIARGVTF